MKSNPSSGTEERWHGGAAYTESSKVSSPKLVNQPWYDISTTITIP